MMKVQYIQDKYVVFSRWSRNSWAVFAARGKQVKIGEVCAGICQQSYAKASSTGKAVSLLYMSVCKNVVKGEYDDGTQLLNIQLLVLRFLEFFNIARNRVENNFEIILKKSVAPPGVTLFYY